MRSSFTVPLDRRAEATVRHLRTLLDEARFLVRLSCDEEKTLLLGQRIERLRREAERLAPDFQAGTIQNGASGG